MSGHAVSPFAPERVPAIGTIAGVQFAAGAAGVRYAGRTDVLLMAFAPGTTVAGTFTRSSTAAAPVDWCRRVIAQGRARALVVNSGNANAFTGRAGDAATAATAQAAADLIGCAVEEVTVCSTGVIGELLPHARITAALPALHAALASDGWEAAARAIMTTDTFPKGVCVETKIGDMPVRLAGIAKGAGMIAPDMATMLSFIVTDAAVPAPVLQALLGRAVKASFNAVTVDSDTSTNDTVLAFATGAAGNPLPATAGDPALRPFARALARLCRELALLVVSDGEGITKLIEVTVTGAASPRAARTIAMAIANSPLVKTAAAGGDANWGRVVMAVGKSGERADRDRMSVQLGPVQVARDGAVVPGYDEAAATAHFAGRKIDIAVDVGVGRSRYTAWTCDLTHGYIDVNADYRS